MYLSFVLMLSGGWLALESALPLLGIFAYVLLTERWFILPEEKRLAKAFGRNTKPIVVIHNAGCKKRQRIIATEI